MGLGNEYLKSGFEYQKHSKTGEFGGQYSNGWSYSNSPDHLNADHSKIRLLIVMDVEFHPNSNLTSPATKSEPSGNSTSHSSGNFKIDPIWSFFEWSGFRYSNTLQKSNYSSTIHFDQLKNILQWGSE